MFDLIISAGPAVAAHLATQTCCQRPLFRFVTNFSVRSSIRLLFFSLKEKNKAVFRHVGLLTMVQHLTTLKIIISINYDLRLLGIRHTFRVPCPRLRLLYSRVSKLRRSPDSSLRIQGYIILLVQKLGSFPTHMCVSACL